MANTRRVDWKYWGNVPNVTILQAIALSLGINPDKLHYIVQPGTMGLGRVLHESPEFRKRLMLAIENFDKLDVKARNSDDLEKSKVTRDSFVPLALSWGCDIPAELAALAASNIPTGRKAAWPWGPRETKLLGHLAAVAEALWRRYDPADPTTAPTNRQVVGWLVKHGVSKRAAEIMAQILRADELPAGNRKR